ncbi:cysteine-rich receptor-like protein kinase 2 [Salvia miltiorrhiza]|uniref:cysteine-rich receptor-like protein kinase 2 n=1 Tax=Salvia miltiorrhiza TaxID=226208 RepID=UPI0025AC05DC|nr:cysteine-rich receptor-like protein kinase 2 [Salvia miltiorrhiza]
MRRWWVGLIVAVVGMSTRWQVVKSQAQTDVNLGVGCSSTKATNVSDFMNNLNATFSDLRTQLSEDKRFATAQYEIPSEPVYGMVQCRDYMSQIECLACYATALSAIMSCTNNNVTGGRAVFDGCFLRYESYEFYARTSENWLRCDGSASGATGFTEEGTKLLSDLQVATPKILNYFAASRRKTPDSTVYGVAQCAHTVSSGGCQGCLTAAYENLRNCFPRTDGRVVDAACFMRYSNQPFFSDNHTTDIQPFLQPPPGSSVNEKAVIGGAIGGAGLLVIIVTILIWYKFSRQLKYALIGNILGATELQRPNRFSYKDLKEATNNFSEGNKIGQGAFGAVYKATLRNESVVAVKKLDISNSRAKADFESEVRLISNVHHRNLVRLLGCYTKGTEQLLVYEFMENKSLDIYLYGEKRGMLSWKQRVDIIFGTARGIAYLHENYHVTIIHRDIKPGNILLDNDFQAKIADFGLARLLPENQSHLSTNFAGTLGYTAPEYAIGGHLSEKVDIYSFGILILEIISGRKCSDMNPDSTAEYLLNEAWKLYERDMHQNLADEALELTEQEVGELIKMVEIAMLCVQSPASSRPSMSQLIMMISDDGSVRLQRAVRRPSFDYRMNGLVGEDGPLSADKSASHATVSITQFTGR